MYHLTVIKKTVILLSFFGNIIVTLDILLKTDIYSRFLYIRPIHNLMAWLLLIMLLLQIFWLLTGYFSSKKWLYCLIIINVCVAAIQIFYFVIVGDL